ncbi:unnamed protein product [Amaranthus hypochondriacus]
MSYHHEGLLLGSLAANRRSYGLAAVMAARIVGEFVSPLHLLLDFPMMQALTTDDERGIWWLARECASHHDDVSSFQSKLDGPVAEMYETHWLMLSLCIDASKRVGGLELGTLNLLDCLGQMVLACIPLSSSLSLLLCIC